MRARSCTCGSQAALRMTVVPGVSAAAISAFSVPITDGSSMKKSHALQAAVGRRRGAMSRPCSTRAPSARKASRCGSSRRRPITSPPGGGMSARPKRASSGPASRNEARMRSASVAVDVASCVDVARRSSATVLSSRHSTVDAEVARAARASPRRRGSAARCAATTSSSVSRQRGEQRQRARSCCRRARWCRTAARRLR